MRMRLLQCLDDIALAELARVAVGIANSLVYVLHNMNKLFFTVVHVVGSGNKV